MKKTCLLILLVVFTVSCGKRKAPKNDTRFDIYKTQFQQEALNRGVTITDGELSIPIAFGETGAENDGVCTVPSMGKNAFKAATNDLFNKENYDRKFILINPEILKKSLFYIEAVVFHELSHCLRGREHTEERSLMNPSQSNNGDYPLKRTLYLDELFGVDTDFDSLGIIQICSPHLDESPPVEVTSYTAFERELGYALFTVASESEVFCVNNSLE